MMSSQRYFQSWIKKNVVKVNSLWGQSITNSKPPCLRPKIFEIRIVEVDEVTSLFGIKKFNESGTLIKFQCLWFKDRNEQDDLFITVKKEEELAMMSSQRYFQSWERGEGQLFKRTASPPVSGQRSLKSGS